MISRTVVASGVFHVKTEGDLFAGGNVGGVFREVFGSGWQMFAFFAFE
jgi:hypothetical protein